MINARDAHKTIFRSYTDFHVWLAGRKGSDILSRSDHESLSMHEGRKYRTFLRFYNRHRDSYPDLTIEVVGRRIGEHDEAAIASIWVVRAVLKQPASNSIKSKALHGQGLFPLLQMQSQHNARMFRLRRAWETRGFDDDASDDD